MVTVADKVDSPAGVSPSRNEVIAASVGELWAWARLLEQEDGPAEVVEGVRNAARRIYRAITAEKI